VSELTQGTADDGFHEIQLSGKQLVFLFIVTTTVIVVVFLCGVKVGRGVRAVQADEPDQVSASAVPTPSQPQPVAETGPPAAEAPVPPTEDTPEELSYHKRLQGDAAPADTSKSHTEAKPQPESKAQAEPKTSPPEAAAPKAPPAVAPARPASAPQSASGAAARQAGQAPDASVPSAGRPGTWVVQVIATPNRDVASSVVKKLAAKGYPAFLVSPAAAAAQPFYKVHVGRYNDRGEAEQISTRIKKEEQFQSWITR
jgi:cell division septation protein DedD